MEKTKMTLHRALAELKLIDAKIIKGIEIAEPVNIHQKDKKIGGHSTQEDFKAKAQSEYDSVIALIERKNAIKSAIVEANGITTLTVGCKQMTIADAINFKTVIKFKKQFINVLQQRYKNAVGIMNKNNETVKLNCDRIVEAAVGKENVATKASDVESIQKPYMEQNEFLLFDPLKISDKIAALEKEVQDFEVDVDAALSEINAITQIEI